MLPLMAIPGSLQKNGSINKKEFEKIRECFVYFDKDGGGSFSCEELVSVMKELRLNPHEEQIASLVQEADVDGDGEVTFEEFAIVMM